MIELFIENRTAVQNALVIAIFLISIWKARAPEQACAATLLGMVVVDSTYHALFGPSPTFNAIDPWHLLLDTGGLFAFVLIALKANRFYPLVLASAQLVAFTAHIVRMLVEPVSSLSYYLLFTIPFWFQILILAIGIGRHMSRYASRGAYRDWRQSSSLGAGLGAS